MDTPLIGLLRRHRLLAAALSIRASLLGNTLARRYWLDVRAWAWIAAILQCGILIAAVVAHAIGGRAASLPLMPYTWIPIVLWGILPIWYLRRSLNHFEKDTRELRAAGVGGGEFAEAILLPMVGFTFLAFLLSSVGGFVWSFPMIAGPSYPGDRFRPADAALGLLGQGVPWFVGTAVLAMVQGVEAIYLYFKRGPNILWTLLPYAIVMLVDPVMSRLSWIAARVAVGMPDPLFPGIAMGVGRGDWDFALLMPTSALIQMAIIYLFARWWILRRWEPLGKLLEQVREE